MRLSQRRVVVVTSQLDAGINDLWDEMASSVGELTVVGARTARPTQGEPARVALRSVDLGRGQIWRHLVGLGRFIRRFRPDLVHVNSELWSVTSQELLRLDCPLVIHGAENLWRHGNPLERRVRDALVDRAIRKVAGYASWNEAGRAHVGRRRAELGLAPMPDLVLPTVIPPGEFRARTWRPAPLTEGAPLEILLVGRLVRAKGFDVAIEAAGGLKGRPVRLTLQGEGTEQAELLRLAHRRGVEIVTRPWKDGATVASAMARSHIQVQPSRSTSNWVEQFGRTVAEAMTVGLPCLVSDSGELPHLVDHDARAIFPEGDVAALRDRLQDLSDSPEELQRMSERQRAHALALWQPANAAARVLDLWARCLN